MDAECMTTHEPTAACCIAGPHVLQRCEEWRRPYDAPDPALWHGLEWRLE
ncbi:MAG: hypothetical protein NVS9B4_00490 [Candidatus Acidiferrum sp.]